MKNLNHVIENILWQMPRKVRKAFIGDSILIRGSVTIRNGDKIYVIKAHNRVVSQGIKMLIQVLGNTVATANFSNEGFSQSFPTGAANTRMRIGSDIANATTEGMTALSSENTTDRNSASVVLSKISAGHYRVAWNSTWNAGTVSGTCGEIGLYLSGLTPLADGALPVTNLAVTYATTTPYLFARLASASGDFVSFTINAAAPLSIEWDLDITF